MDFVPITPYETDSVVINIGQRYDLTMKADQPSADYWLRADNQQPCGQLKNLDIKGIVHYSNGPNAEPAANAPPLQYAPTCLDEPSASLVPVVPWSAGSQTKTIEERRHCALRRQPQPLQVDSYWHDILRRVAKPDPPEHPKRWHCSRYLWQSCHRGSQPRRVGVRDHRDRDSASSSNPSSRPRLLDPRTRSWCLQ